MEKDLAEIFYVIVNQSLQIRGRKHLKLSGIAEKLNKLRDKEGEEQLENDEIQRMLQSLAADEWIRSPRRSKTWKVHSKQTDSHIIKDVETARFLDTIVKYTEEKEKDEEESGFEISVIVDKHFEMYPALERSKGRSFFETDALKELEKGPYISTEPTTGLYYLRKDSYYPEPHGFKNGEKHYIDLILKYEFREL